MPHNFVDEFHRKIQNVESHFDRHTRKIRKIFNGYPACPLRRDIGDIKHDKKRPEEERNSRVYAHMYGWLLYAVST